MRKSRAFYMVIGCANPLGERYRRARAVNIRVEADYRAPACGQKLSGMFSRALHLHFPVADPCNRHSLCYFLVPGSTLDETNWAVNPRSSRRKGFSLTERLCHLKCSVVFDIGEALIRRRRTFQRSTLLCGLPLDDILDLLRQFEVLVRDAFCSVIHQPYFDPRI